jgi:hypothetical protein
MRRLEARFSTRKRMFQAARDHDITLKALILAALREKYPALGIEDADLIDLRAKPMSEVTWQTDPEFIGANHAEHAMVGDYELLVFDLPADRAGPAFIGWELFGPPRHQELIDQGDEQTFEDAKAAAERAFAKL